MIRSRRSMWMLAFSLIAVSCRSVSAEAQLADTAQERPIPLVFDTDIGNDIDDALAMGVIHVLICRGECELLAVTVTKDHPMSAAFVDAVNTFYGSDDVPVGVVHGGPTPEPSKYTALADQKDGDHLRFPHRLVRSSSNCSGLRSVGGSSDIRFR